MNDMRGLVLHKVGIAFLLHSRSRTPSEQREMNSNCSQKMKVLEMEIVLKLN
jgi:hypothetical protein